MKYHLNKLPSIVRRLIGVALAACVALPLPALAAAVALATAPLATSTTSTVKPNVMFILDDSGSMGLNYLPDWVNDEIPSTTTRYTSIPVLLRNSGFNGVAYNPAITYTPAVLFNADGTLNTTTYPSKSSAWNAVKIDGFNVQNTGNADLLAQFPDVEWCTNVTDGSGNYTDCLRNDNLLLPGTVTSKNYTNRRVVFATGTGSVASGQPDAPTTSSRTFGPFYYSTVPGEYCTEIGLRDCQVTQTATYNVPAKVRWCNSATAAAAAAPAAGTCQGLNSNTFSHPRYPTRFFTPAIPGSPFIPAVLPAAATAPTPGTIRITGVNQNRNVSIQCAGTHVGVTAQFQSSNSGTAATRLDALFTSYGGAGGITANGYKITCAKSGTPTNLLTCSVTAPVGPSACPGGFTIDSDIATSQNTGPVGGTNAVVGSPAVPAVVAVPAAYYGSFVRTDIIPATASYPKATTRTDCAGATCSYNEEMTNFANWWAYYQTRMQAMKTSVSRAFKTIDNRYRVGFTTILYTGFSNTDSRHLNNNTFELAHKNTWFTKLFATPPSGFTPLRGALSKAGRYYGKKLGGTQVDPVQYSCQQNFAILSTDGYWNTNAEVAGSYTSLNLAGGAIGDMDGGTTLPPMKQGTNPVADTLADIAKYYYDTDLRTSALGNCAGGISSDFPSGNPDVCTNNVFVSATDNNTKQHMTTFTMGLGIDGTLNYQTDYLTATSGDFYNLKNSLGTPTVRWPDPIAGTEGERIDDLWHAAVNGQGTYFSAKDPDSIVAGFKTALSAITAKLGAAAAAATSTLNPVAGNNFAYVASYTTNIWKGNLESRTINVTTGVVSEDATWCVENITAQTCASPATVVANTSGSSTVYNCVLAAASVTSSTCTSPGVFDGAALPNPTCTTEIATSCTGTMPSKVADLTDTRNIYTANAAGTALVPFDAAFATANPTFFNAARINTLSQWGLLNAAQQTAAQGTNLVNFLRGQKGFEDRTSNLAANRLYRSREAVLGDALESQPSFIGKPVFSYPYPGYSAFKATYAGRAGNVYMGTNDGMMHAFAAATGIENWAYIPSMVVPNLWKLADTNYQHVNYVNGSPITSDICTANCTNAASAVWKTILVGGLNGGGRGYYALDITSPTAPSLLWEFKPSNDADLGYTFGLPIITRKADGTWVVLVTSGYDNGTLSGDAVTNNSPAGNGKGYLYVLNAGTGALLAKITTNVGDATTPSGLAKIAAFNDEPGGNKTGYVYGGDLQGNLWRFDINSTASAAIGTGEVLKFATLLDGSGVAQPITTTPQLGKIDDKRIVFIGTGKYLETSDLSNTQVQSQYAIKDDDATSTLVNARTSLVQQTLTNAAGAGTRSVTDNAVDFESGRGWYFNFPDSKERVNIDARLVQGTLLIPSIVPANSVCSPGGYGWLNFIDYKNGGAVATGLAGVKYDSTIVGVNVLFIDGKPVVEIVTSTNPTPEKDARVLFGEGSNQFVGKRVLWRELIR